MITLNAEKYRENGFEQIYLKAVYEVLSENMKGNKTIQSTKEQKVVREIVRFLQKYGLLSVLEADVPAHTDVDDLDEETLFAVMKALILADEKKLREMYERLETTSYEEDRTNLTKPGPLHEIFDFLNYFGDNAYEHMRKKEVSLLNGEDEPDKLPNQMVKSLELRTCPYCNRAFIGTVGKENLGVQLDHFYSKSIYPIFAVCLYNLIPSCSHCNRIKTNRDDKELVSPFRKGVSFEKKIKFELVDDGKVQLVVDESDSELTLKSNVRTFKLKEAYNFHNIEGKRFVDKMRAYPPSLIREIARHMTVRDEITGDVIEKVPVEALEMGLFQEYFCEPADYIKKPLAKFYRDLYYEYRGWE